MTDETTETETETAAETAELGDAGTKAIRAERARADKAEKALKALQLDAETRANAELSELERFKKEAEELRSAKTASELEAIRYSVALEKGLPANLAARLQGTDRESIEADADSLSELVGAKPTGQVRADHSQGTKSTVGETSPATAFADALRKVTGR